MILRVLATVQQPPPWRWLAGGRLWQRVGPADPRRLPLELMQQLHWWSARPLARPRRSGARQPQLLPRRLAFLACWLNAYRPHEVRWWQAVGVTTWRDLQRHSPDSHVPAIHACRRQAWPDQCRPALALLSDKAALLALTPASWCAPFLRLGPDPSPTPPWWEGALTSSGLVLKPLRGHGGRGVWRFRWQQGQLEQLPLFRRLPADCPPWSGPAPPQPQELAVHWQALTRRSEPLIAAPYLTACPALPPTDPTVVVRVITARPTPQAPIAVEEAWLEIPLGEGAVAFVDRAGRALPCVGPGYSDAQQHALHTWQALLAEGLPAPIGACLEAALALHARIPPIDRVAWDWIPASPQPLLLEGNGGFGLLVPQLMAFFY